MQHFILPSRSETFKAVKNKNSDNDQSHLNYFYFFFSEMEITVIYQDERYLSCSDIPDDEIFHADKATGSLIPGAVR